MTYRLPPGKLEEYGEDWCAPTEEEETRDKDSSILGRLRLVALYCIRMVSGNLGSVSRGACWPQLLLYGYVSNSIKGYYPDLKI